MSATAKKQKPLKRHPSKLKRMSAYMILAIILISIMAVPAYLAAGFHLVENLSIYIAMQAMP